MNRAIRLNVDDWVQGRAEILERQYIFGDQSDFASLVLDKLRSPVTSEQPSWFETLADRLTNTRRDRDPQILDFHLALLDALARLNAACSLMRTAPNPGPKGARSGGFLDAQAQLSTAIEKLSSGFGNTGISQAPQVRPKGERSNRAEIEIFPELLAGYRKHSGFWLALDLLQQVYQAPLLDGLTLSTEFSAIVPVVFWAGDEQCGYVLWLKVELFPNFPGPFYPDLTQFGLTNISKLIEPMSQVWNASGVSEKFRGRWSITTQHPLGLSEFYQEAFHREDLGGSSLQAAALAAVWAASGKIPLSSVDDNGQPEFYSLGDNQALKLNPRVAISGRLVPQHGTQNDSIKLGGIAEESITGKIKSLRSYGTSRSQLSDAFDTVLIVREETAEAREAFPQTEEEQPAFSGIHLIENCDTMADALFWMLEVNSWKKELGLWTEAEWQKQWGYARNDDGLFLDKTTHEPIVFQKSDRAEKRSSGDGAQQTSTTSNQNWNENWNPFVGHVIKVDDDSQEVTLQLDPENENHDLLRLSDLLKSGLRAELERQVKARGSNTGSLEFMRRPIPGATDDGGEQLTVADDQSDSLDGTLVADDMDHHSDTVATED